MTHAELADLLLDMVRAQRFDLAPDALAGGAPIAQFPSLDLALVAFPENTEPVWANVLFSREHPQGLVADIGADAGAVRNIRFEADRRDAAGTSDAWLPDADWSRLHFEPLAGPGPHRFVAPYPASLIKLVVAVGVARVVDAGRCAWDERVAYRDRAHSVAQWCDAMLTISDNDATEEMVALLHHHGGIDALHDALARAGLATLRLDGTRPDGGWRNGDGAGVGHLHMTAWDALRLVWLLDADAPAAPWLARATPPIVSAESRARIRRWLDDQALHDVLSSTALAGVPDWTRGLPAELPPRWIDTRGAVQAGAERAFPPDVRAASAAATVRFAHKTGATDNYASDAGIVRGIWPARRHYLVALTSNLGRRYAPGAPCATTWKIPALGRAIDDALAAWLERAA